MDSLIKRFDFIVDGDLNVCEHRGVAYENTRNGYRVSYDGTYYKKVHAYEDTPIANAVNQGRCDMVARRLPPSASLLDYGAGTGAFVRAAKKSGFDAKGFDVMQKSILSLVSEGLYAEDPHSVDALCLWDTLEHLEDPELILKSVKKGSHLFVSLPIYDSLAEVKKSKHYRPGEHLYHFTAKGFIEWIGLWGFRLVEYSTHEVSAGRDSIGAFAFVRDYPDYHDFIKAYSDLHASRYYGSSAVELHLARVAEVVRKLKPKSILDYGCGRSDLVAHFWLDGDRRIGRYDPAIPTWKSMPEGQFDLVFLCDVMEHVPMSGIDLVLRQAREKASTALLTISTKLARAKLLDGTNAHVTLLRKSEWLRWIASVFGSAVEIPCEWEHELVVIAGAGKWR